MRCPGQDMRFWKPGDIFETPCPKCGRKIEFFKDEVRRKCGCGHEVVNPKMDLGCAAWCQYAEQCVGVVPEEMKARQRVEEKDLLRERISLEMKKFWGTNYKRVNHALKVARYAEKILRMEGGNPLVVIGAAYLHDLGRHEAEIEGRNRPENGKREGVAIVREILERLAVEKEAISEIVDVINRLHSPRDEESLSFQILYEADWLARMEERKNTDDRGDMGDGIQNNFRTTTGRQLLGEFFSRS
jgi:putative nucleotidyltransferase with HDIG domain